MPASLHLARFTPRHALRTVGRLARGWDDLLATPGLTKARLFMLGEMDMATGGRPTPLSWALLCGWADGDTRDDFCDRGSRRLTRDARESWGVAMEGVRVRQGGLQGWVPPTEGVEKLAPDEPVVVMTHGRPTPRYLWRFTVENRRIVREMTGGPGLSMMAALVDDSPLTRATVSVWDSQRDVVRFAYTPTHHHAPIQREAQDVPWGGDWFFARFRPLATTGSWNGRDPVSGS